MKDRLYYNTYKFYDERGRRLSIFALPLPDNCLKITVLVCSKKDRFSRKVARKIFEEIALSKNELVSFPPLHKTARTTVIKVEDGKLRKGFIEWCRKNFAFEGIGELKIKMRCLVRDGEVVRPVASSKFVSISTEEDEVQALP